MKEDLNCVCCHRTAVEQLSTNVFSQDPSGEWWCQKCIDTCLPLHIAADDYSIEEER